MQIPAAMFIESAIDILKDIPEDEAQDQRKELHVAIGDKATPDFIAGYELGLQVARVMLMLEPKAREAGITL